MAEEDSEFELEGFKKHLESLFDSFLRGDLGPESKTYCARFCKLVEEYTGRWQEPLPQLRVLQSALCSFFPASACFPVDCEHVQCTLSSLALSVFELLLFFGQSDFLTNPLKDILDSLQECYSPLAQIQNVHLLQVRQVIAEGGSWVSPALHSILTEAELPQDEVDRYLGSEMPVFLELRVRYLMANRRDSEAMALAKVCTQHPVMGRHPYFLQVYLTCLLKASHHDRLHKVIAEADAKDGVDVICYMETEEEDDGLVLTLCRAFLSQQLHRGDMYYMWDLVFIWSKLQLRVNPSKQALLDQSHQLMLSATNLKSIFPFMRVILAEVGKEAHQFCVELCIHALQSDLSCDPGTKSLMYKTIAYLLPSDLEVCRACALLVFFLERSLDAYKTVFLLYTHPDQEYHAEASPVGNHVRFDILQVLKRGLYFDPEFWNLMALRTNCLKLMSERVVSAALVEILEEQLWLPSYCTKEPVCRGGGDSDPAASHQRTPKKRLHKDDKDHATLPPSAKRTKTRPEKTEAEPSSVNLAAAKKRGKKPGSPPAKEVGRGASLRRSFRQLDSTQENLARQFGERPHQHMTRLSEQKPPKRKIRKPRWLIEEAATLAENSAPRKGKKPGRKPGTKQRQLRPTGVTKRPGAVRNNGKQKTAVAHSRIAGKELQNKRRKEFSTENGLNPVCFSPDPALEVSHPDNELPACFTEDADSKQINLSQKSPHRPCVASPVRPRQTTDQSNNEVIIRACDAYSLILELHSYAQSSRVKRELPATDKQASDSTTTVTPLDQKSLRCLSVEPQEKPVELASQSQNAAGALEIPSEPHESAVASVGVPRMDESSSGGNGRLNDPSYLFTSENSVVCNNTVCASQVSAKSSSSKRTEALMETLATDITSVSNVTAHIEVRDVPKEPAVGFVTDKTAKETIITEDTVVEKQPTDVTNVPEQSLPCGNTTAPKETTNTENKSLAAEDPETQMLVLLAELTKDIPGETMDTNADAYKEPKMGETGTGIIPENKTTLVDSASVLHSKISTNSNGSPVTETQPEPESEPTTGAAPQPESEPSLGFGPQPESEPSLGSGPQPESETTTDAGPLPQSEPTTDAGPQPESEPFLGSGPQPESEPSLGSGPQPELEPTTHAGPQPESEPSLGSGPQPESEPTTDAGPQPESEPSLGSGPQPESEPTTHAGPQPESEPSLGSGPQPESEPTTHAGPQPESEPSLGSGPQPESEPTTDAGPQPESEPSLGSGPQPESEPTTDAGPQPESEPSLGSGPQPESESTTDAGLQPESEPTTDAGLQPESEPTTDVGPQPESEPTTDAGPQPESERTSGSGPQDTMEEETPAAPDQPSGGSPHDPEDSLLVHRCTMCNKVFKGKRVEEHAMYHCRQDQCMFCGMPFNNDDILAMMHLSEHMEKLKKGKAPVDAEVQGNCAFKTAEPQHQTPSGLRRGNRKRTISDSSGSTPSDSRRLRSSPKLTDAQSKEWTRKIVTKPGNDKQMVQRVNGHFRGRPTLTKEGEKQISSRQEETLSPEGRDEAKEISPQVRATRELRGDSTLKQTLGRKETPCPSSLAVDTMEAKTDDTTGVQESVRCPVEGCPWPSGQLRHRQITLLTHALDSHHGDLRPLEVAFSLNRRCSICHRVCWSFRHYREHVQIHRDTPRHPCLHLGCGARFKTGREMRLHTRRHLPLRAGCCFSGCTELFVCLWALNLHEREHYGHAATAVTKTESLVVKKLKESNSPAATAVEKTESSKVRKNPSEVNVAKKRPGRRPKDVQPPTAAVKVAHGLKVKNKLKRGKMIKSSAGPSIAMTLRLRRRYKTRNKMKKTRDFEESLVRTEKGDSSVSSPAAPSATAEASNRLRNRKKPHVISEEDSSSLSTFTTTTSRVTNRLAKEKAGVGTSEGAPPLYNATSRADSVTKRLRKAKATKSRCGGNRRGRRPASLASSTSDKNAERLMKEMDLTPSKTTTTGADDVTKSLKKTQVTKSRHGGKRRGRHPASLTSSTSDKETERLKKKIVLKPLSKDQDASSSSESPSTSAEGTQPLKVSNEVKETETVDELINQRVIEEKGAPTAPPSSIIEVADEGKKMQVINQQLVAREVKKVTSAVPPNTTTKLTKKLKVTDPAKRKETVKKRAVKDPSKVSKKPATTDPLKPSKKSTTLKVPVADKQIAKVAKKCTSPPSTPNLESTPAVEASDSMVTSPVKKRAIREPSKASIKPATKHPLKAPDPLKASKEPTTAQVTEKCTSPPSTANLESTPAVEASDSMVRSPVKKRAIREPSKASRKPATKHPLKAPDPLKASKRPTTAQVTEKCTSPPSTANLESTPVVEASDSTLTSPVKKRAIREPSKASRKPATKHPLKAPDPLKASKEPTTTQVTEKCMSPPSTANLESTPAVEASDSTVTSPVKKRAIREPSKASRKPATKHPLKAPDPLKASKQPTTAQVTENCTSLPSAVELESKPSDSTVAGVGYHVVVNGHSVKESPKSPTGDAPSTGAEQNKPQPPPEASSRESAAKGKKPFRLPPTAYLDERYTTMPKRRKEMSWSAPRSPKREHRLPVAAAAPAVAPPQRRRCAKCFSSFSRPEELQTHLELKKCASLFGFDSDEESNW